MKGLLKVVIIVLFAMVSCSRMDDTDVLVVGGGASGTAAGV